MKIKTIHDGWDCVPELKDVIWELGTLNDYVYEIKNCVRTSDLESMVDDMNEIMDNVKHHLSKVDTTKEYKTLNY
jgi:hypothetical protein